MCPFFREFHWITYVKLAEIGYNIIARLHDHSSQSCIIMTIHDIIILIKTWEFEVAVVKLITQ